MGLRDVGEALPPGFRFYPSDEELVCHYLYKKIANEELVRGTLVEIDLHVCEPWQLPDVAKLNSNEWYFFSFRDRKYSTGYRTNRATTSGYWKATGKDRPVLDPDTRAVVGMRKTLVFYRNRAPNGIKTGWIMHEFRLENPHLPPKEDWVLCRVFYKSRSAAGGENSNPLMTSPQNLYIPSCPNLGAYSPPKNQQQNTSPNPPLNHYFHHYQQSQNPSNATNLWAMEYPTKYLHDDDMSEPHSKMQDAANTKSEYIEDDYGLFMLDFNGSLGVPSTIQDMEFDDDIQQLAS